VHRTVLCPLHGFGKGLICLRARSLGVLATTPRHPLTQGLEGHTGLTARRSQGGTAAQRDADSHLHGHVQLRRSASRARAFMGVCKFGKCIHGVTFVHRVTDLSWIACDVHLSWIAHEFLTSFLLVNRSPHMPLMR
jgi:hypothetical protein